MIMKSFLKIFSIVSFIAAIVLLIVYLASAETLTVTGGQLTVQGGIVTTSTGTSGGGGGSGQWYYSMGSGETPTLGNSQGNSVAIGVQYTTLSGKSATKLSLYRSTGSSANCKIGIYNSSNALMTSCTATMSDNSWCDCEISSQSITGNVQVMYICDSGTAGMYYTGGDGIWDATGAYAAFPWATMTNNTDSGYRYAIRVWAQ